MKRFLLFSASLAMLALLYFGLTRDPRTLPSAWVGKPAPEFELTSLEGKKYSLKSLKGKPVVLNFWATWCGPCLMEHRFIREAQKWSTKTDLVFLSVLYEDTPENARSFIKDYGAAAPVLVDERLRTALDYGVSGVPETFFIDRDGIVVYKQAGVLTGDILYAKIQELTQ